MQLQQHEAEKQRKKIENQKEREIRDMQERQAQEADYKKKLEEKERQKLYNQALTFQKNLQDL